MLGSAGTLLLIRAVVLVAKIFFFLFEASLRSTFLMSATMLRQIVGTREGFAAMRADVWTLLCVGANMPGRF